MENDNKETFPKPGPLMGIAFMVFELVVAIFGFSTLQIYFGMWGLVLTEIGIALIALLGAWVTSLDIREMLPIRRIKISQVLGTVLLWMSTMYIMLIVNMTFFYFFPEGMEVGAEMSSFFGQWPFWAVVLVVAVMPAICEEMLHRGFIQRCMMRKVKSKLAVSILMGIFFGIFHLDFYRFLGTAFLGGVMAYILVSTDNFIYNMLFHFINNLFAELVSYGADSTVVESAGDLLNAETIPPMVGTYMVMGFMVPFIMLAGILLLKGKQQIKEEGTAKLAVSICIAGVMTVLFIVVGVYLIMNNYETIMKMSVY